MGAHRARVSKWLGWLLTVSPLFLGVIRGVIDWVGRTTFLENLIDLGPKINAVLSFIARQPGLAFYVACAALFIIGLLLLISTRRTTPVLPSTQEASSASASSQSSFTVDKQIALTAALRAIKGTDQTPYTAHILFASKRQRPIAEKINAIFEAAGWETNPTKVPLDRYLNHHFAGIEVKGPNEVIVSAVVDALARSGLSNVRALVQPMSIKRGNHKWEWGVRRVDVTVGHSY